VTYVPPQPRPPAAAAASEPVQQQPREETDYVSRWCAPLYAAEIDRLKRELAKKDREIEASKKKSDEYKAHVIRIRNERDSLKGKLNVERVPAPAVPLASSQSPQQPAAAAVSEVSNDAVSNTKENTTNCRHQ